MIVLRLNEISEYDVRSVKKYKITLTAVEEEDNSQLLLDLYSKDSIKELELELEVGCEYKLSLKKVEDEEDD